MELTKFINFKIIAVVLSAAIVASAGAMAFTVVWLGSGHAGARPAQLDAPPPKAKQEATADPKYQVNLETFTVNLGSSGHFLRAGVVLACSNSKVVDALSMREAQTRDRVISVLRSQSITDLRSVEGLATMKKELVNAINPLLASTGRVVDVYFTEFVVD